METEGGLESLCGGKLRAVFGTVVLYLPSRHRSADLFSYPALSDDESMIQGMPFGLGSRRGNIFLITN